jgi:hypothetical protein
LGKTIVNFRKNRKKSQKFQNFLSIIARTNIIRILRCVVTMEVRMDGYVQADEIAAMWDISVRQVQYLCKHGKIDGASKFGNVWAIPKNAEKPTRTGEKKPGRKPKE